MFENDDGVRVGAGRVVKTTAKALLIRVEGAEPDWWPRSQIHDESEITSNAAPGDEGDLVVTQWFAEQRGLA